MPRDANGYFTRVLAYVPGTKARASDVNSNESDIAADLNAARPIVAGGTGGTTAEEARQKLGITDLLAKYLRADVQASKTGRLDIYGAADSNPLNLVSDNGTTLGLWNKGAQRGYLQVQENGGSPFLRLARNGGAYLEQLADRTVFYGGLVEVQNSNPTVRFVYPGVRAWFASISADGNLRFVDESGNLETHKFYKDGNIGTVNYGTAAAWFEGYRNSVRQIRKASRVQANKPAAANASIVAPAGCVMDGIVFQPSAAGASGEVAAIYYVALQVLVNGQWYNASE